MSFKTLEELSQALLRLRLVEPSDLDAGTVQLAPGNRTVDGLLDALERRGQLTSYQLSRLRKGETDGLRLGEHKLLYRNAAGSFARVYRGCSVLDGRMVGLKVLRQRWAKDPQSVQQFRREAELCRKLRHKNIVPIYDIGSQDDYHWFTMEFVEGGNLRDFLAIRTRLSLAEATQCVLDMAEGLEYALGRGVTHRDLKLTNVLMSSRGVAKLVDFGLAGLEVGLSGSGAGSGDGQQRALEYATLEKSSGSPPNDSRTDLYFLGAIYYELVTGIPPYPRTNDREERRQITRYRNVKPLRQLDPNIPRCVTQVVERLMQVVPDLRYQSPTEAIADLRLAVEELAPRGAAPSDPPGGDAIPDDDSPNVDGAPSIALPPRSTQNGTPRSERQSASAAATVLIVESRHRNQEVMRKYFTKHGFRVLMLSDADRAVARLKSSPPDALVLLGEVLGDDLERRVNAAVAERADPGVLVVAVLGEKQGDVAARLGSAPACRALTQPVTLRDLRRAILEGLGRDAPANDS